MAAFKKTGDAPVSKVLCSCGGEVDKAGKCAKCGKEHLKGKKDAKKKKA